MWTQSEAIKLSRRIEAICPKFGCHVALTGGLLYKDGERKDADFLFYRIRQHKKIDADGLFDALQRELAVFKLSGFGWCFKARWCGKNIDFFFPEEIAGPPYEDHAEIFEEPEPIVEAMQTALCNP